MRHSSCRFAEPGPRLAWQPTGTPALQRTAPRRVEQVLGPREAPVNQAKISEPFLALTHYHRLTKEQKRNNVPPMFWPKERDMLRTFVEEAAALASIVLFVGMIAVWAQLIPQL